MRIQLVLNGRLRDISARFFSRFIEYSLDVLGDLDRVVSEQRGGTLQWNLAELRAGSAVVELESRVVKGDEDVSGPVTQALTSGIVRLHEAAETPPFYTIESVRKIRDIVRDVGRDGVTSASIIPAAQMPAAELTRELEPNLDALVGVHHRSLGSVSGRLEAVSLHPGSKRFYVYNVLTNRGVRCNLPKAMEDAVLHAISGRRRVVVSGIVSYNAVGEPISVKAERLKILEDDSELPTVRQLLGAIPDITGDLSTEDHLRMIRGG